MQVKDIMTHGLITASLGDDLTHLMRLMTRHRVRHMPVLRNGKLVGIISSIISIGDVVKHRLDDLELEASTGSTMAGARDWQASPSAGFMALANIFAFLEPEAGIPGITTRRKADISPVRRHVRL